MTVGAPRAFLGAPRARASARRARTPRLRASLGPTWRATPAASRRGHRRPFHALSVQRTARPLRQKRSTRSLRPPVLSTRSRQSSARRSPQPARARVRGFSRNKSGSVSDVSTRARSVSARARSSVASGLAPSPRLARCLEARAAARRRLASAPPQRARARTWRRAGSLIRRASPLARRRRAPRRLPRRHPRRRRGFRSCARPLRCASTTSPSRSPDPRPRASKKPRRSFRKKPDFRARARSRARLRLRSYFLCAAT